MRLTPARWASRAGPSPIAAKLATWFAPGGVNATRSRRHDGHRKDIISSELCREALNILRPTLPVPGSCDVIDINPGAAIWTQALHDAIKPRRHILVEPEKNVYSEAIDPLLEAPESVYRHTFSVPHALDLTNDLLSNEFKQSIKCPESVEQDLPRKSVNQQLIVVANLTGKKVSAGDFKGELTKLFLDQFYRAIAFDNGALNLHQYGLVRLLAWIPEREKQSISPRGVAFSSRLTRQMQASCYVREIVSSFHNDSVGSRRQSWYGVNLDSMNEVARRQPELDFKVPTHRKQPLPEPPSIYLDPVPANFEKLATLREKPSLVMDFIKLYRKVEREHPVWLEQYLEQGTVRSSAADRLPTSDNRIRLSKLRNRMRTTHNRYDKVDSLARQQINLERELLSLREQFPDDRHPYEARLRELQPTFDNIKAHHANMFKDDRHAFLKAIDDYRALTHHILAWYGREFEPLLCHSREDFYPSQPMSLLELTPKPSFVERISTYDRQICFDYINHEIEQGQSRSVQKLLNSIIGSESDDSYKAFVDSVPSLTDPLLGGYHDLSNTRTRTLTMDALVDLAVTYEAWPLRRRSEDLLASIKQMKFGE